jgi:hypothetical protein
MLDDGWSNPGDSIGFESWTVKVVTGNPPLSPDRLEKVLVALEEMARKRLAQANTAALTDSLELDAGDNGAAYVATYAVPTAVRALHRGNRAKVLGGQSAGGLSYGYRVKLDDNGRAIPGERVIDEEQAAVVRRIYKMYSEGVSLLAICARLNAEGVPAPRGEHWKQNTLNGNAARGTGILNNEIYRGVIVWNRLEWRRDPESEERRPVPRDPSQIERVDTPHLRIVDEALWLAVKARQAEQTKGRPSGSAQ